MTSEGKIIALAIEKGRTHDFKVFKESKSTRKIKLSKILADLSYLGIQKISSIRL